MLDVLRASKGGILSWIFLGAIIATFVLFFGPGKFEPGGAGCGGVPTTYAARVDGEPVPAVLFTMALQGQEEVMRYQFGDRWTEALPIVAQQIMDELVRDAVVAGEADRRGIRIPRDDLYREQRAKPEFQQDGKFSSEWFRDLTNRRYGSVDTYLTLENQRLAVERLQAAIQAGVHVPEAEVQAAWREQSDLVDLAYVVFPIADARAEVKLTEAEVQAFAAKQAARIQKFYDENAARYDQPSKVRARHVLAKIEGSSDEAAKKKIEEAIARLEKGEDFATVAAELSDDASTKASGGDLGVITDGQVDEAFAKAALGLEPGKLSEPVRTPSGWHVIRADEVMPGLKIPLADVRTDIARELLSEDRARDLVQRRAETALAAAKAGKPLTDLYPQPRPAVPAAENRPAQPEVKAALTLNGNPVVATETNPIPASTPELWGLPGSGPLLEDARAARSDTALPKVYETQTGPAVAVVRKRERPDEAKYPVQRRAVELALRGEKQRQLERIWRAELEKDAEVEKNQDLIDRLAVNAQAPQE